MIASVAAILFAAAITPGPNNLVVMDAGRGGLRAALAPIAGVVLGTLGLVFAVRFGLGAAMAARDRAEDALRVAGAALLFYLALRTMIGGWARPAATRPPQADGALFASMLALQLVNPKTWVLATAVAAAHAARAGASLGGLAVLAVVVPTGCLLVWAIAGRGLGHLLERSPIRQGFATLMAAALAGFAVALLVDGR